MLRGAGLQERQPNRMCFRGKESESKLNSKAAADHSQ